MKKKISSIIIAFCMALSALLPLASCNSTSGVDKQTESTQKANDGRYEIYVYDENNQTFDYQVIYVPEGNRLKVPEKRYGKEFLGFYSSDNVCYFDEKGNQAEGLMINKDLSLYLHYEYQLCTIRFDACEGRFDDGETIEFEKYYGDSVTERLPVPHLEGYTFVGWKNAEGKLLTDGEYLLDGMTQVNDYYCIGENNTATLKAYYEAFVPRITLDYNDGTGKTEVRTVRYGEKIGELPTVDNGSSMLVGWATYKYAKSNEIIDPLKTAATENVTLYAVYSEYRTINLVYTDNNVGTAKVFRDVNYYMFPMGEEAADWNPGYNIVGWYKDPAFTGGTSVTQAFYNDNCDVFYADWTKALYTMTFLNDDGTPYKNGAYDRDYDVESAFALPTPEPRAHYTFLGWCRNEDLSDDPITEVVAGTYKSAAMHQKWLGDSTALHLYAKGSYVSSIDVCYGDTVELGQPNVSANESFVYWYVLVDDQEVVLTDMAGRGLSPWNRGEAELTVLARINAQNTVTVTYIDPKDFSRTISNAILTKMTGDKVALTKPNELATFEINKWVVNGEVKSTAQSCTFTMPDVPVTVEIHYSLPVADFTVAGSRVYKYDNHLYAVIPSRPSKYYSVQSYCELLGGHIVTFESDEERAVVQRIYVVYEGKNDGAYSLNVCEWDGPAASKVQGKRVTDAKGDQIDLELYSYGGHLYSVVTEARNWISAEQYAEQLGGHLATVTGDEEDRFISRLGMMIAGEARLLIGATDYYNEGEWVWVTGEPFTYTNWKSGEPDNGSSAEHYAHKYYDNDGRWNDVQIGGVYPFVIEWESPANVGVRKGYFVDGEIRTAADMERLKTGFPESAFILKNDIDMTGISWTPFDFSGTLDGAGHTIKNLTIESASGDLALFGKLSGTVKDLKFENVKIKSTSYTTVRIATIAVEMSGTVSNVKILSGSITGDMTEAGGIAATVTGRIENCENRATVGGGKSLTEGMAGGIAARANSGAVIDHCTNSGKLNGYCCIGGIVGTAYDGSTVSYCTNLGIVEGKERVAGLIATVNGSVRLANNNNQGAVTATGDYAAGIIAYSSNTGNYTIDSELVNSGTIKGQDYVGGIYGYYFNSVYCPIAPTETLISKLKNHGTVEGKQYVGGIVGYFLINTRYNNGIWSAYYSNMLDAYDLDSTGTISGIGCVGGLFGYAASNHGDSAIRDCSVNCVINGEHHVGGIAGQLETIGIMNCSNSGSTIHATGYLLEGEECHAYVGGYVGFGYSVSNCENAVAISYSNRGDCIGGIAGCVNKTVTGCSNSGKIEAPKANFVGGIAGKMTYGSSISLSFLSNSAAVNGKDYTGGVFGYVYCYQYDASPTVQLSNFTNTGNVAGKQYVGGIGGCLDISAKNYWGLLSNTLLAYDFNNSAGVSGTSYVGGIIGRASTTSSASKIIDPVSTGKVTGSGSRINKFIGQATNVSIES